MAVWLAFLRRIGASRLLGALLLLAFCALRYIDPLPLEALRLRAFDFYQILSPRIIASRPVTIVDIDEASLKAIGQWPWPRTMIADMVTQLTRLDAAAVGFDVFFPEADRMSPASAAASFRGLDAATREKLSALPNNDDVLAKAIANGHVVLARSALPLANAAAADEELPQTGISRRGDDPAPFLMQFPGLLHNLPILEAAAEGRALVTMTPERDGIIRRLAMAMQVDGIIAPSLPVEMLNVATGAHGIYMITDAGGIVSVGIHGLQLPTDGRGRIWAHFAAHDPQKYVSAKSLLDGTVPPEMIAGKLVLIGTSALGLLDNKTTPVDAALPGVEVHAQVIEAALSGAMLSYPAWAPGLEILISALVSLAMIALAPVVGARTLFLGGGLVAVILVNLSWYAYASHKLLLDATFPLGSTFLVFVAMLGVNYLNEQNARQKIRSAFGQYLSPALVEQLAKSPEKLVLGGQERAMTIMFSDVRGFTALSESYKHDPQGLTALMNRFLTPLTNAILARKGTIDKYMGDAIMAFWNAPLDDAAHELNACLAALDMLACIERLNAIRKDEADHGGHAYVPIKIGIGVNSGVCVVGNMGSDLRFDYSVLGDAVNIASRIEGQSKDYGVANVIGSATAAAVGDALPLIELDRIKVKGKTEPEAIYTILGGPELKLDARVTALGLAHAEVLRLYRADEFAAAQQAMAAARIAARDFHLDGLYDLLDARCTAFLASPPPGDWDGVFVATSK